MNNEAGGKLLRKDKEPKEREKITKSKMIG